MKIFLDTANIAAIKKLAETGLINGVTTNPSHLSKEAADPKKIVRDICALLPEGEISVEVTEKKPNDVYKQARDIAALSDQILVKIPCHKDYFPVIKRLVEEDVSINVTLVFTLIQGLMMAKLGVTYISPFIGRWDDIDISGIELLPEMREMIDTYGFQTQILAASLRSVRHMHDAILAHADAITVSPEIFATSIEHPLTDQGIALFDQAWAKLGIKQFP